MFFRLLASTVTDLDLRRPRRSRARHRRLVAPLALLVAASLAAGCGEDVQGPERGGGAASLSVLASVEAAGDTAAQQDGGGLASAFRQADGVTIRVVRRSDGSVLTEVERAFEPGEGTTELRLEISLDAERVPATLELALQGGEDRLFRGAAELTLEAGETETVELGLEPVPAELEVSSGPVTFEALGARRQLSATARFATGDPIPGVDVQWSGSDASVVEVRPDGEAIARGPGEAQATATLEELSGTVALVVDPAAASVTVTPSSAELGSLGTTRDFSASVVDANGNPVADAEVSWSSTDVSVVRVDATGRATANGAGTAEVVASAMGVEGRAQVAVSVGPAGRLSGRVSEVQVGGLAAASAGASALPTGPLGGVTVEFLQDGQVVSRTSTASDGSWTSPELPVGTYDIRYVRDGFVSATLFGVGVTEGTTGSVLDVPLVPGSDEPGTATGRVTDPSGGGIAGATVALRQGLNRPEGEVVASAETGSDGGWRIEGAPAGTYTLTASAEGFRPASTVGAVVGGQELGGQDLELEGNQPPTVTIEAPADGDRFAAESDGTAAVTLEASGQDPDGTLGDDAFAWESSVDGDLGTGRTLTVDLSVGEHTLTVTVTDAAGSTATASVTVTVSENQDPEVSILRPEAGASFQADPETRTATVTLEGEGTDPEDGELTGQSLFWRNGSEDLGFGRQLTVQLPPGEHTLVLVGTDSQGATGQATVEITVAQEIVVDFEGLEPGTYGTSLSFPGVTFRTPPEVSVAILEAVPEFGFSQSLCPVANGNCMHPLAFDFDGPVRDLRFQAIGDDEAGVAATVTVFRNGQQIGTHTIEGDGDFSTQHQVDLSEFGAITSIEIEHSDPAGLSYDDVTFRIASTSEEEEPSASVVAPPTPEHPLPDVDDPRKGGAEGSGGETDEPR